MAPFGRTWPTRQPTGARRDVVLLRSADSDVSRLVSCLADRHRLVLVDVRGDSPVNELLPVLRRVGSATVVAAGVGAPVAICAAFAEPDRVEQLVLCEPRAAGGWPDSGRELRMPLLIIVSSSGSSARTRDAYTLAEAQP